MSHFNHGYAVMNLFVYAALSATASLAAPEPAPGPYVGPVQEDYAQITITRKTVVSVRPVPSTIPVRPIVWKEHNGPKCVDASQLVGLAIRQRDAIDLVLRGGIQIRAKLEKGCGSADFYSGFYMKRTKDGRICEDRDLLHSRTGGSCEIDRFRSLRPEKSK